MTAIDQNIAGRIVGLLIVVGLMACAGCGSRYIDIAMDRPVDMDQPAWVGVYFLDQETALDGFDNVELADPDAVDLGGAVVQKEVFSLRPGATRPIRLDKFDERIQWVVVAAGFPGSDDCARKTLKVKEGAKLNLAITILENCIDVQTD